MAKFFPALVCHGAHVQVRGRLPDTRSNRFPDDNDRAVRAQCAQPSVISIAFSASEDRTELTIFVAMQHCI